MNIGIVSGKGGTGKTTISTGLANVLKANYVDMDAEEPNGRYFLDPLISKTSSSEVIIPENTEKCTYCGICADKCQFSALAVIENTKRFMVFSDLCHHCGLCIEVCPVEGAIKEKMKPIGTISFGTYGKMDDINFIEGNLNIGEATSVPLLEDIKTLIPKKKLNILDSSPGASCPVVSVLDASDYIILAGEPTPFGVSDLEVVYELVKELDKPMGLIINKYMGDNSLHKFAENHNIDILGILPFSRKVAENYSSGGNVINILHSEFEEIGSKIMKHIGSIYE